MAGTSDVVENVLVGRMETGVRILALRLAASWFCETV